MDYKTDIINEDIKKYINESMVDMGNTLSSRLDANFVRMHNLGKRSRHKEVEFLYKEIEDLKSSVKAVNDKMHLFGLIANLISLSSSDRNIKISIERIEEIINDLKYGYCY